MNHSDTCAFMRLVKSFFHRFLILIVLVNIHQQDKVQYIYINYNELFNKQIHVIMSCYLLRLYTTYIIMSVNT